MNYRDKFYSKYVSTHTSHLYGEVSLEDIKKQFPVWRKLFGRFLPKDKNAKIIDLGCGNGSFVYWLQQNGYLNAEGVDVSPEQIKAAQDLGIKNIYQDDCKNYLTGKKEIYDCIFMLHVLEHFNKEEVLDILEIIHQSLKINGILVITTPNAEAPVMGNQIRYGDFTHDTLFARNSIRQVLSVSNFKDIEVYPVPPMIHGFKSLTRFILWKCYVELKFKLYLLVETGSAKGIFTNSLIAVAKK